MSSKAFILIMLTFFLAKSTKVISQTETKNKFNSGFDIRSGFFAGFDHRFTNYSIGLDAGTSWGIVYPIEFVSLTLDNSYYFGNSDKYEYKTWYLNARLVYANIFEKFSNKPSMVLLVPGIGKDFNLTSKFGFSVSAGLAIMLSNKDKAYTYIPTGTYYEFSNAITPNLRVEFNYRF